MDQGDKSVAEIHAVRARKVIADELKHIVPLVLLNLIRDIHIHVFLDRFIILPISFFERPQIRTDR